MTEKELSITKGIHNLVQSNLTWEEYWVILSEVVESKKWTKYWEIEKLCQEIYKE